MPIETLDPPCELLLRNWLSVSANRGDESLEEKMLLATCPGPCTWVSRGSSSSLNVP